MGAIKVLYIIIIIIIIIKLTINSNMGNVTLDKNTVWK